MKIEEMNFQQSWRIKRAVKIYNLIKDKPKRIETVQDLLDYYPIIDFLGVGKKTTQYFNDWLEGL